MWVRRVSGKVVLAVGLLLAALVTPAAAAPTGPLSWQALGAPTGPVTELALDQAERPLLYAVSRDRALYHSVDGGTTWRPTTNNLPPGRITAIGPDQQTGSLYAAVAGSGVPDYGLWRSADQGATWAHVGLDRGDLAIQRIVRNADGRYLLLGLAPETGAGPSYVYRSGDNGSTWEQFRVISDTQGMDNRLLDLVPDPKEAGRLFAPTSGGQLYHSTDAGQTWAWTTGSERIGAASGAAWLAISPDQPETLLLARGAGSEGELVLEQSTDGGVTWHKVPVSGLPARAKVRTIAAVPNKIWLLNTGAGTYRTTDDGIHWRLLEGSLSSGGASRFVVLPGARNDMPVLLAATGYGLFISRDAGALWQPAGSGLPLNSSTMGLMIDTQQPGRFYAISNQATAAPILLNSTDGGQNWKALWPGLPLVEATAWALGSRVPGAALYVAAPGQLLRSQDGGLTWQTTRLDVNAQAIAVAEAAPEIIYLAGQSAGAAGGPALLRSADSGATWAAPGPLPPPTGSHTATVATGLAIDPGNADHLWLALPSQGVYESLDGGRSWQGLGLEGKNTRWLAYDPTPAGGLYAGIEAEGILRHNNGDESASAQGEPGPGWSAVASGLPISSTVRAFLPDTRTPGTLWAAVQDGSIYRSLDRGNAWSDLGQNLGDNQIISLATDPATPGGIFAATEHSGIWTWRPSARNTAAPQAIDARIEIVWPHGGEPVATAEQANVGLRLFMPDSLVPPSCSWAPKVTIWQALDTNPATPLATAAQQHEAGRPLSYWELNDVDVRAANDAAHKIYFMVQAAGATTATSVWAHGADTRTYMPLQDVPSGIATEPIDALDARIEIVWPHDAQGNARQTATGAYANVGVALFKHGTRLSVPVSWRPAGLTLYGAWNQDIGRPLKREAVKQVRQSGAVAYPMWEFLNIPVAMAADPANKLFLWVVIDGVETYPTIWTHGADARTYFPIMDELIQGCTP